MPFNKSLVDGMQALDAQERALNFIEQATFAKVLTYEKSGQAGGGTLPNEAVLQDVPIGQQPGPLSLVSLPPGGDATPAISAQLQAGKNVVFHAIAFVDGTERTVLGFR